MGWTSLITWLTIVAITTVVQLAINYHSAEVLTREHQQDHAYIVLLCSVNFFINLIKCSFIIFLGDAASQMFHCIPENLRTRFQYPVDEPSSKTMMSTFYFATAVWYVLTAAHATTIVSFAMHQKRGSTSDVALVFLIGEKCSALVSLCFDAIHGEKVCAFLSASYMQYLESKKNR